MSGAHWVTRVLEGPRAPSADTLQGLVEPELLLPQERKINLCAAELLWAGSAPLELLGFY